MRNRESGQVLILFLAVFFLLACCWATLLVIGLRTIRRIHVQDTADAVALSVAVMRARGLNASGFLNAVIGPMMIQVRKGPLIKLIKAAAFGELLLHPEYSNRLNSLPDNFWLVYNPLVPQAKTLKALFTAFLDPHFGLQTIYFGWGGGAQIRFATEAATANGMVFGGKAMFSTIFINSQGNLQPLQRTEPLPTIIYFSSYAGIPFLPIEKGKGDLLWLKDKRHPRSYTVAVQNQKGDLYAVSAARPYDDSGAMFPIFGEPLVSGDSSEVGALRWFSWLRKVFPVLQKVACWAGVSWGIEATIDYLNAWKDGWNAQLVPVRIGNKKVSQLVHD